MFYCVREASSRAESHQKIIQCVLLSASGMQWTIDCCVGRRPPCYGLTTVLATGGTPFSLVVTTRKSRMLMIEWQEEKECIVHFHSFIVEILFLASPIPNNNEIYFDTRSIDFVHVRRSHLFGIRSRWRFVCARTAAIGIYGYVTRVGDARVSATRPTRAASVCE